MHVSCEPGELFQYIPVVGTRLKVNHTYCESARHWIVCSGVTESVNWDARIYMLILRYTMRQRIEMRQMFSDKHNCMCYRIIPF